MPPKKAKKSRETKKSSEVKKNPPPFEQEFLAPLSSWPENDFVQQAQSNYFTSGAAGKSNVPMLMWVFKEADRLRVLSKLKTKKGRHAMVYRDIQ